MLLLLGGAIVTIVVTICAAIFAGREVTMWPPHIAAYEPAEVRNCNALIKGLPEIRKSEEDQVRLLGENVGKYYQQVLKLMNDSATGVNSVYVGSAISDLKRDIEGLNKRLDGALEKVRKRNEDIVAGCLSLGLKTR